MPPKDYAASEDGVNTATAETGDGVLAETEAFVGGFVVYPSEHARIAHVLWIAHTHLMGVWNCTPRIAFLSPEPASGKTRALEVAELLVPRPMEAVNMSASALFRSVGSEDGLPTNSFRRDRYGIRAEGERERGHSRVA